jgi:hypothetical protein
MTIQPDIVVRLEAPPATWPDALEGAAEIKQLRAEVERLQQRIRALEGMLGERVRATLEDKP